MNKTPEEILDSHYKPKMHWKAYNRHNVLIAMHEYASQFQSAGLREAARELDEYLSQVNYEKGKPVYLNSVGALSILHKNLKAALAKEERGKEEGK